MSVSPVQNNNSQSFGMALHLEGKGPKTIAKFVEEVNNTTKKEVLQGLRELHNCPNDIRYDGDTFKVATADGAHSFDGNPTNELFSKQLKKVVDFVKKLDILNANEQYEKSLKLNKENRIDKLAEKFEKLYK